jgi:hypothetical protein
MEFRTSQRFRLSGEEQRLLEWLCEQYQGGEQTVTFQTGGQCEDERLKQLEMSLSNVETVAKRLEAWGREHWNISPKWGSGTPPVRVERDKNELRLMMAPQITDICGAYKAWLGGQQREQE